MSSGNGKDASTILGPDSKPATKIEYELAGIPLIFGETLASLRKWFEDMVLPKADSGAAPPHGQGLKPPKDFALLWMANAISNKRIDDKITRLEAEIEVLREKVAELAGS